MKRVIPEGGRGEIDNHIAGRFGAHSGIELPRGLYLKSKFGYFEENLAKIIEKTDKREDDSSSLRELLKGGRAMLVMHAFVPHNEIKDIDGMMVKAEEFIEEDCFISPRRN